MGVKNKVVKMEGEVKYSDERMAYMSSRSNLVVKKSDTIVAKDIWGEDILNKNSHVVLCEDQNGYYLTIESRIDDGCLDANRTFNRNNYTIEVNGDVYTVMVNGKSFTI